jgi:flagellar hook-associated protein 3 FlgL
MRISDSMIYSNANASISGARARVTTLTAEASSGIRVNQPGDDPSAAAGIVEHSTAQAYADAVSKSATAAADELNTADGALNAVSTAVQRARELAVQLANDTYNASDRADAAPEVQQAMAAVVAALNVKSGNRYIFGGTRDQGSPFASDGTYNGDAGVRSIEIAPGVQQVTSVRADVALKGTNGGVDVLAAMASLATALANNDPVGINTAIGALQTGTEQVAALRSQVGADGAALTAAAAISTSVSTSETKTISTLQSVDIVEASTQLQLAETALQAAVSASTQSFKFTLLNPNG